MPENKRVFLEVNSSDIKIKELLGKDFLELTMRTVSSACPNRNGSWFTKEAQEKALATYNNKPVLGYFEGNDFVSHDGVWRNDPETGMQYWDTLGVKGERILGLIRSEDQKKVVYDEATGLYWTEITCALWTQYSYKQVKRLLHDAMKSKNGGGPVKNVSVEIDILDSEDAMVDGKMVEKINDYSLVGITILGSKNGVKVEPGIAGAGLSIRDFAAEQNYGAQCKSVMAAYALLSSEQKENQMEDNQDNEIKEAPVTDGAAPQGEGKNGEDPACESAGCGPCKEDEDGACPAEHEPEDELEHEPEHEPEDEPESEPDEEHCDCEWLSGKLNECQSFFKTCYDYYDKAEGVKGKKLIMATVNRMAKELTCLSGDLDAMSKKVCAEDYVDCDDDIGLEDELSEHCSCKNLYMQNKELQKQCDSLKSDCAAKQDECNLAKTECASQKEKYDAVKAEKDKLAHEIFMMNAKTVLSENESKLTKEDFAALCKSCESGDINSIDALKERIVFSVGKAVLDNKVTSSVFAAPVPSVPKIVHSEGAETSKNGSIWDRNGYNAVKR